MESRLGRFRSDVGFSSRRVSSPGDEAISILNFFPSRDAQSLFTALSSFRAIKSHLPSRTFTALTSKHSFVQPATALSLHDHRPDCSVRCVRVIVCLCLDDEPRAYSNASDGELWRSTITQNLCAPRHHLGMALINLHGLATLYELRRSDPGFPSVPSHSPMSSARSSRSPSAPDEARLPLSSATRFKTP